MVSFVATTVLVAALAGVAQAAPIKANAVVERGQPEGWATAWLEPYGTYHSRYIALDCQDQHNTTFFDECCHPLLSNETLAIRPDYCTPNDTQISDSNASATASATEVVSSVSSALADAQSEYNQATSTASAAPSSSTVADADAAFAKHTSTSTSTYVAPTTTSSKTQAAATTTAASSGGSGETMTGGYATFFYQGGAAGECGTVHSDSEYGIAIDAAGWWSDFESNDNSPYCGKQIAITNSDNGKSVTATVWDVCPTCNNKNSLDLSVGAFQAIASESDGMVPITWQWA